MSLFEELKRRNVFRVGAAYLVVGWVLIQIGGEIFPAFGAPDWVPRAFILLIALGLPIALLLAWAFELTADGLKKTGDVDAGDSVSAATVRKLNYVIISALVLALGYFVWESRFQMPTEALEPVVEAAAEVDQSIAVLPFVNLSSDPEQEYFSDGMTEEILNALAKIRELRVAARTSAFQYKGQNLDLRTVGRDLGVGHILEGSVRKAGNTVRITAQLIEVDTGFHLWSETYDRELENIFAVQDEISLAIADALSITLNIKHTSAITGRTQNLEAYDLYLQALTLYRERRGFIEADRLLRRAVVLDPNFALGWATLSQVLSNYGVYEREEAAMARFGSKESQQQEIRDAAERAYALAPELPRVLHALGQTRLKASDRIAIYERALEIDPSNAEVMEDVVGVYMPLGLTVRAVKIAKQASALDPIAVNKLALAMALTGDGQYERAKDLFMDIGRTSPSMGPALWFGVDAFTLTGDLEGFAEHIEFFREDWPGVYASYKADLGLMTASMAEFGRLDPSIADKLYQPRTAFIILVLAGEADKLNETGLKDYRLQGMFAASWIYNDPRFADLRASRALRELLVAASRPADWRIVGFPKNCRPVGEDDFACE